MAPFSTKTRGSLPEQYLPEGNSDQIDEKGLAVEESTGLIASFNTPELICEKTKWAIETGLGGVMVWHYHCDVPADNDASLFNAITRARTELAGTGT